MAKISATEAILYAAKAGDASLLLAPPYDVIDDADARRLRDRSEHNAVHLILPEGEPPRRYELAASRLAAWLDAGTLKRSPHAALYAYRQTFAVRDRQVTRQALLAAVQLTDFEEGQVLPHETTHRGPKVDRLALMNACRAQLSPIFFVTRDPERRISGLLDEAGTATPLLAAKTDDGILHEVREIAVDLQEELLQHASRNPFLIADGHHRYETALELRRQLPDLPAAGAVLGSIVSEHDAGLVIRATHRRVAGLPPDWRLRLERWFEVEPTEQDPRAMARHLDELGGPALGVTTAPGAPAWRAFLLARPDAVRRSDLSSAGAGLACLLFDRLVLREMLGHADADSAAGRGLLTYEQDPCGTPSEDEPDAALFLLPPVAMERLWQVVGEGIRLPPKSTYFAPKMPSGLLFRPL